MDRDRAGMEGIRRIVSLLFPVLAPGVLTRDLHFTFSIEAEAALAEWLDIHRSAALPFSAHPI